MGTSPFNVHVLACLCTTAKQDNQCISVQPEVDPVPRSDVNSILHHARADAFGVRQVSSLHAHKSGTHSVRSPRIETVHPAAEWTTATPIYVLPDFYDSHAHMVVEPGMSGKGINDALRPALAPRCVWVYR